MTGARDVALGQEKTTGQRVRELLEAKNPYAANVLASYLRWANRVATRNGYDFGEVMAHDLED